MTLSTPAEGETIAKLIKYLFVLLILSVVALPGCTNNPYRPSENGENVYYTTFVEPPKHLDPARAYSSDEYAFIAQIYEPPLQYHYLERPYRLVPLTAREVPEPEYLDDSGRALPDDAPPAEVHRAVYEISIRGGIMYQPHPAFAWGPDGELLYADLAEEDLEGVYAPEDFSKKGSRELTADDYIYQIKRLADPRVESPILSILQKYILGMREFSEALRADLEEIRARRREAQGAAYNMVMDERRNPISLDYGKHPFPGVEKVGRYTYRITLKTKYPQFRYWLAMPFFSPMPEEVVEFYRQGPLSERNITLDRFPVGTGPYRMDVYNPNMEIVLKRNENFPPETYPETGEPGDREAGLLKRAGDTLPFVEKVVFKLEKEAIPRWNKFLQGYYDNSGLTSDSFDQAVTLTAEGGAELTPAMKGKNIKLITAVQPSIFYLGFNMLDDVVGGYGEDKQKLRQAISIAVDYEEYIEIFNNGRGLAATGPLPPGIFGHQKGREGLNPYVYRWDEKRGEPVRRSIEYARELLAEAGYPGGRDAEGRPLAITFDNPWTGPQFTPIVNWYIKRLRLLGVQLENRTTDYNRFREKMRKGNFQVFAWGWNADYPDPENFLFLLAGRNSKVKYQGENVANYANPEFDRLFKKMENMDNSPERLEIIEEMVEIARRDAPWVWGYYPVAFGLYHQWVGNIKANAMANNTTKYLAIAADTREELRKKWNRPRWAPVAAAGAALIAVSILAALKGRSTARRR